MCHASAANSRATIVGIVDWNTIAPVMLPIARVSLPCRTQMTELNFSGNSVAIGAMTRARISGSTPSDVDRCSTASTKKNAPTTIRASAVSDLEVHDAEARHRPLAVRGRGIEAVEAERGEILEVDGRVVREVAPHVPAVDADEYGRDDPLRPRGIERQERRPDRDQRRRPRRSACRGRGPSCRPACRRPAAASGQTTGRRRPSRTSRGSRA